MFSSGLILMGQTFQRKVSPIERLYIAYAEKEPPFTITAVLEGTGNFDESRWKEAVAAACEANPGSRLLYKGRWAWAKWVDSGVPAPVRFVDGSNWSGYESENAPFLFEPMPFRNGYTSEVLLINGSPPRVVFRTSHAIMDGGGTTMWILDIFRALRKEPLVGSGCSLSDSELVAKLNFPRKRDPKRIACLAPTGKPDGNESGIVWKRATLEGRFSNLLPQLALAIAKEARKQGPGNVRLVIPLDLRKRLPDVNDTGNLARRILLDVPPEATVDSIQQTMKDQLDNLTSNHVGTFLVYLPMSWVKKLLILKDKRSFNKRLFRDSGTISNLGRLPIEQFHGGGFKAESCFYIAPEVGGKPFFTTLSGCENTVEMVTTMPKVLASNGRLDRFIANITAELKPNPLSEPLIPK